MTQPTNERLDAIGRALLDSKLAQTETWFRSLLEQVKLRIKTKKDVMHAIEQLIIDFPVAVPLICEMARAEYPNDVLVTNEFLNTQTINSFNARLAAGDKSAVLAKSNYLFSIGRKEAPLTESTLIEGDFVENGEQ